MSLQFTWEPRKAAANLRKHHVGFPEAATAFADPHSITIADLDHSVGEEQFVLIGQSDRRRLVVVAHVKRGASDSNHQRPPCQPSRAEHL